MIKIPTLKMFDKEDRKVGLGSTIVLKLFFFLGFTCQSSSDYNDATMYEVRVRAAPAGP